MSKTNKIINCIFVISVLLLLLFGLGKTLLAPVEINEYENRYAEKIAPLHLDSFLCSEFQDSVENGLADQVPFAIPAKRKYNEILSSCNDRVFNFARSFFDADYIPQELKTEAEIAAEEAALEAEIAAAKANAQAEKAAELRARQIAMARGIRTDVSIDPNFLYIHTADTLCIFNDHLLYANRFLPGEQKRLDKRIDNLNALMAQYPEYEYYMYYIEKETDVNFETGERSGIYEYLCDRLSLPEDHTACYMVDSFAQFDSSFYKADHHWNHRGSYTGYKNILKWLLPEETPLETLGTYEIGTCYGSKATGMFSNYSDTMSVYEFDFPEMSITVNGQPASDYGAQSYYIDRAKNGEFLDFIKYGSFYGGDEGEIIFENPSSENGSILVLGESFDNAILKPLASHFTTLYSVDLRNFKAKTGNSFDFGIYMEEHGIDRVLFVGNLDYYVLSSFFL